MKPLPEDRHRSPFVFAMLFSDLLPASRVRALIDGYIAQGEQKLALLEQRAREPIFAGERFANDLAHTMYTAILDFLHTRRADIEGHRVQAAE
jgi:hypothetical protein